MGLVGLVGLVGPLPGCPLALGLGEYEVVDPEPPLPEPPLPEPLLPEPPLPEPLLPEPLLPEPPLPEPPLLLEPLLEPLPLVVGALPASTLVRFASAEVSVACAVLRVSSALVGSTFASTSPAVTWSPAATSTSVSVPPVTKLTAAFDGDTSEPEPETVATTVPWATVAVFTAVLAVVLPSFTAAYAAPAPATSTRPSTEFNRTALRRRGSTFIAPQPEPADLSHPDTHLGVPWDRYHPKPSINTDKTVIGPPRRHLGHFSRPSTHSKSAEFAQGTSTPVRLGLPLVVVCSPYPPPRHTSHPATVRRNHRS